MVRRQLSVLVISLLVAGACSSSDSTESTPGSTVSDTAAPTTATRATTSTAEPAIVRCPNPHGGECLGALGAGSYSTAVFEPRLSYTVPNDWTNLEDLPGNFLLQRPGDSRYLGVYQNVRAPAECDEVPAVGVGGTVDDLEAWYTTHPGLLTTEPRAVTIGGLEGVFVDISLDPSWDTTCPHSDGQPVVPFIIGNGTSELHHVILPGFAERLYLLEWNGGNVAIEVGSEGQNLDEWLEQVSPIIESMKFAT